MDWTGRTAILRLSESGRAALTDIFEGQYVEAFIQSYDEQGLWLLHQAKDDVTITVVLVKWGHFETAMLDVVLEEPQQPKVIGFGKRQTSGKQ